MPNVPAYDSTEPPPREGPHQGKELDWAVARKSREANPIRDQQLSNLVGYRAQNLQESEQS